MHKSVSNSKSISISIISYIILNLYARIRHQTTKTRPEFLISPILLAIRVQSGLSLSMPCILCYDLKITLLVFGDQKGAPYPLSSPSLTARFLSIPVTTCSYYLFQSPLMWAFESCIIFPTSQSLI